MNKKVLIIIIVAVVVIAAAIGVYLIFSGGDYSVYTKAFKNTFDVNSMELNTSVKASVDGGSSITSTGSFMVKDINGNTQFVNDMNMDGRNILQFSDGEFIYTDDGQNKNKVRLGGDPEPKQQERQGEDFSFDAYISEFSSLLDASKIKELNAFEPVAEKFVDKIESSSVNGGKKFIVTLLPAAVDELVDTFLSENLSDKNMSPTIVINSIVYSATVVSNYISEISFKIDMDITAPGESTVKRATVDFVINPVNPGQQVRFDLPDTDEY